MEANFEEGIDMKNQSRIKTLPNPISIREATSKKQFDKIFNDPCIKKPLFMLTSMIKISILSNL